MSVGVFEESGGTKGRVMGSLMEIQERMDEMIAEQLEEVWQKIYDAAVAMCPKDTGALASSIKIIEGAVGEFGGGGGTLERWIFDRSIIAGDAMIINPRTGLATDQYAFLVHDGHRMRNGMFWEGEPFLDEALAMYWDELEAAVDKAMKEMGV